MVTRLKNRRLTIVRIVGPPSCYFIAQSPRNSNLSGRANSFSKLRIIKFPPKRLLPKQFPKSSAVPCVSVSASDQTGSSRSRPAGRDPDSLNVGSDPKRTFMLHFLLARCGVRFTSFCIRVYGGSWQVRPAVLLLGGTGVSSK